MNEPIYVLKANGDRELFDINKLEYSLKRAGASSRSVEQVILQIRENLSTDITTNEIYKQAFELLRKEEKPVALKYSLKRAIMEFGPSGFPFEDFVAEILKVKGYKTETGKIIRGFCVEHEVDVVAWNPEKLIMIEAKFHNVLGVKSDLKVALYVKARFDDLGKMTFNYDKERKLDEGWLITNTKFTSTAIEYGSCQGGLRMIGWNYPPVGNLHDMILESKLHPLTCLTSLNGREKKLLLDRGVVLCKTILDNSDLLYTIGLNDAKSRRVLEEIKNL